jgi:hypothetical protein
MEVRRVVLREEERLRKLEREQAAARDKERRALLAAEATLAALAKLLAAGKQATQNEIDQESSRLARLEKEAREREAERTELLIEARWRLLQQEEELRLLERRQAFEQESAQDRLRAAWERFRQAEARLRDPVVRGPGELERTLDALRREVAELRRAVERLNRAKGQ